MTTKLIPGKGYRTDRGEVLTFMLTRNKLADFKDNKGLIFSFWNDLAETFTPVDKLRITARPLSHDNEIIQYFYKGKFIGCSTNNLSEFWHTISPDFLRQHNLNRLET